MSNFLQKSLVDGGFKCSEITEELLLVEDFISKEEIEEIMKIINSVDDPEWEVEYLGNLKDFCMEKFGRDDVDNLVAEGKFEITQNWKDKNLNIIQHDIYKKLYRRLNDVVIDVDSSLILSGFATIQRMQPGVTLTSHTDQHTDPSIRYAAIVYINDDYSDGELFFKNKSLDIKPRSGSLLIFPGDHEFEHGVRTVGEGPIRYVLVGFIKVKGFYKYNKY